MSDFPILTSKSGKFATHSGNFYTKIGSGAKSHWRRIELYLSASPKTYGFTTHEEESEHRFNQLESGERVVKYGLKASGCIDNKKYQFGFK